MWFDKAEDLRKFLQCIDPTLKEQAAFHSKRWVSQIRLTVQSRVWCPKLLLVNRKRPRPQTIGFKYPNTRILMVFGRKTPLFGSLDPSGNISPTYPLCELQEIDQLLSATPKSASGLVGFPDSYWERPYIGV